jgi:outer membrane receptor protein involved in Fe transport
MSRFSPRSVSKAIQVLGCIFAVLLLCVPAFSQTNFGRILGTVTDSSGGVVSGAAVSVVDTERGVSRNLTTDDAGEYNAPTLNPGTYTVRVEAKGFRKFERQNIVLEVGKEVRIDMTLQPGAQEQTVTVTEAAPLVETTNATLGGTLDNSEIVDMPLNGRNYQMLLSLRPGVMIQPGGGPWTQATNGIRPDENAWMIDGVINANFFDSRPIIGVSSPLTDAATILPIDAIQEFNTMENPKAEAGWKPGAVVNVGIKSGTNTLHGSAYAFGRTDSWDARNSFNPAPTGGSCLLGPPVNGASPCDKTPAQLKQFGAAVGGPIKKDKLFFFGAYEGLRSLIGNSLVTGGVPETTGQTPADPTLSMVDAINCLAFPSATTCGLNGGFPIPSSAAPISAVSLKAAGCTMGATAAATACTGNFFAPNPGSSKALIATFPITNQTDNGVGKLDYRINGNNTLNGLLVIGKYTGVGMDHPFVQAIYNDTFPIKTWTTTENWIWTPNSIIVNELRFGYDRFTLGQVNDDASVCQPGSCPINTGLTVAGVPQLNITGFNQIGTQHNRPQTIGPNPYFDVQDSVSYLKGKHTFKFGVEFAHVETDSNIPDYARGRINFKGNVPLENYFAGIADSGIAFVGNAARVMTFTTTAGFVQDDWRVTSKVIVNLGLRYSYNSPFKADNNLWANFDPTSATGLVQQGASGVDSMWKPDHKNFSPRIGFAWDVTGNGTTVVRGGASIIYSTFTSVMWMSQNSFSNSSAVTLASNPTSANLVSCPAASIGKGACAPGAAITTPGSGNLAAAALSFANANNMCWDPSVDICPAGQTTVFPTGTKLTCGDGVGADPGPCPLMGVDPNLKTPRIFNFNLGIQHQFGSNLSLEVGYVGNHGDRLTGFNEINQPLAGAGYCFPGNPSMRTAAQNQDACNGVPAAGLTLAQKASAQAAQEARPFFTKYPYLSFINEMTNRSRSNYHSLQATLTKRTSHGVSFIAGYTFAHGLDNGSLNRYALLPQNSGNTGAEYGSGDFDVRHRFTLTATYNIPGIKGYGQLLEGWQLNSIVNLQSAQPWSVNDYKSNYSGVFDFADRWDFTGDPAGFKATANTVPWCGGFGVTALGAVDTSGVSCSNFSDIYGTQNNLSAPGLIAACASDAKDPTTLKKGGCYGDVNGKGVMTPPALGAFGNMPRNIFRDSGFRDWDLSIFKNFTFKERYGVQFRWELFNVLNHPIPANPFGASNNASNANNDPSNDHTLFGGAGGTPDFVAGNPLVGSGSQRVMQLGLKLTF